MAKTTKTNICYHSLRLNMDNEQHQRVEKVLSGLNTEVYKSVNKFIVDSIDFYVRSLDGDTLVAQPAGKKEKDYLTREDFSDICTEIKEQARDEVIRMLGMALAGSGHPVATAAPLPKDVATGTGSREETEDSMESEGNRIMAELASGWG